MRKKVKSFRNEDQERDFWSEEDSTRYFNWEKGEKFVFPNLKPSNKTISLRLPEIMLAELKMLANKKDVPYQSLVKIYLAEMLKQELNSDRVRQ